MVEAMFNECVQRTFAECCSLDLLGTYVGAVMNGIDLDDDSIAVSCYLTLPDEMPYLLEDMLVSESLRVLRVVNRANTLSRRYGWRTRCLPSPPCRIRSGGRTLLTPRSPTSRSSTCRLITCRESRYG